MQPHIAKHGPTHTHAHTHTHTHTHNETHTHAHYETHTHAHTHYETHTHAHTHYETHTHTHWTQMHVTSQGLTHKMGSLYSQTGSNKNRRADRESTSLHSSHTCI